MAQTHDFSTEIYINSASDVGRLSNTLSNWTTQFAIPVQLDQNQEYAMSVMSAAISNTFPQFHETETKFKLNSTEFVVDDNVVHANTTAMCQYLSNLCAGGGIALVFTLDSATQRIRITNSTASNVVLDLSPEYLPFWEKIGFEYDFQRSLIGVTLTPSDDTLFNYICRLVPTQRIFITCNQIKNNSYYPTNSNRPILCQIDITGGFGTYSYNERPFFYEHDLSYRKGFSTLSFAVLDDKFREMKMRGGNVNISLVVKKVNLND